MLFTRIELDILIAAILLGGFGFLTLMAWKRSFPPVETIVEFAALFNQPGGIIMFLWAAWAGTLTITLLFGIWVIRVGIDPQHSVVVTILGMLISQAFGNVNGALFKTMTGEPKPVSPGTTSSTTIIQKGPEQPKESINEHDTSNTSTSEKKFL
jgi:hypothetical protein